MHLHPCLSPIDGNYQSIRKNYLFPDFQRDSQVFDVAYSVHLETEPVRDKAVDETAWLTAQHAAFGLPSAIVCAAWLDAPEAEVDALLAAQAILSPVAAIVSASAKWVARNGGDADKAESFLRQLISSSLSGLASDDLITALNTPDGFNQRLRLFFEQNGLTASVNDGLSALSKDASDA